MADENGVLGREGVRLGLKATDKWDAVRQSGALLDELGAVDAGYPEAMIERERTVSTFIGEGVAIPHGTDEALTPEERAERDQAELDAARRQTAENKAASKLAPVNREATPREA